MKSREKFNKDKYLESLTGEERWEFARKGLDLKKVIIFCIFYLIAAITIGSVVSYQYYTDKIEVQQHYLDARQAFSEKICELNGESFISDWYYKGDIIVDCGIKSYKIEVGYDG